MRTVCSVILAALIAVSSAAAEPLDPAFARWVQEADGRAAEVHAFESYLQQQSVGDVLPVSQLLLNATSWRGCVAAPEAARLSVAGAPAAPNNVVFARSIVPSWLNFTKPLASWPDGPVVETSVAGIA